MIVFPNNQRSKLRDVVQQAYRQDENAAVNFLLSQVELSLAKKKDIHHCAYQLVEGIRQHDLDKSSLDAFLAQYDLSSEEGIALMCLAEALLRIPDNKTADRLIADKISTADWDKHRGKSDSFFVNASTWALMLTGKVIANPEKHEGAIKRAFKKLTKRSGGSVVRAATMQAMKILGKQFVMGQTMPEALKRAKDNEKLGYRYSYDMLGEAAYTQKDADRYFEAYVNAIDDIGKIDRRHNPISSPGISVKLSALHPRYEFAQHDRLIKELVPKLLKLAQHAKKVNISLTVDAEEANVLEPSLDILEMVFADPSLKDWEGLGLAVQSYQKRAFYLLDWLIDLAKKYKKRWMVRLIKGAYWDSEIKMAQVDGLSTYPVFTRKKSTDLSFLACAKKMLAARDSLYCMFGSHNAYSVAAVMKMAGDHVNYEFQCLHGMGHALYDQVVTDKHNPIPCRIYAPVGNHKELLPYLVRRLLENGANTSFVNRIKDAEAPIDALIADPCDYVSALTSKPHPKIPLPKNLFVDRENSIGLDLNDVTSLSALDQQMDKVKKSWVAGPIVGGQLEVKSTQPICSPFDRKLLVGKVSEATEADVKRALDLAKKSQKQWAHLLADNRAACLDKAADLLEKHMPELMAMLMQEAGKTLGDAVAEVREAVDFCRYYALQARQIFRPKLLPGPTGEYNELSLHGRGIVLCISPWNFPLAIFVGQIVAALVTGNAVIAKPAEQTPLVAAKAVQLLHEAGVPKDILHLLPGQGETVGAKLVADSYISAVMFTGSTDTARSINQTLANRPGPIVPLIAETGGQNTMIVDSSALLEQVVADVLLSAFGSAGQRCSALRVLFIQEDVADRCIEMLAGAMQELVIGYPQVLSTDVGPVIDQEALDVLEEHVAAMGHNKKAKLIYQCVLPKRCHQGHFFAPCAFEIESLSQLKQEIFGPFLHVIRYRATDLPKIINQINDAGYGLTQGIHSRVHHSIDFMRERLHVGNLYVNRNTIGAVVGVQPFGGEGLSGTGPKAGGPHYLYRLTTERTLTINTTAAGGNASLLTLAEEG